MTNRVRPRSGNAGISEVSYYDLVLLAVPVPLFVGVALGELLWLPSRPGLVAGAGLSALVVGHVLFFDPPTRRGPGGPTGLRKSTRSRESGESRGPTNGPSA